MQINQRNWGENAHLYDIVSGKTRLSVSNLGALWQAFVIDDTDFVLGYDTPEEYEQNQTFFGAMIGPIADRMADGRCILNGQIVQLEQNAGPDSMHSSNIGFHKRIWQAETLMDGVRFSTIYQNEALPGNIRISLAYRLLNERCVRLEYAAETDTETALSFTNHSYFNLHGGKRDCLDHRISVFADRYAETLRDVEPIVSGKLVNVAGTPMDLQNGALLGDVLRQTDFRELRTAGGVDHFFMVNGQGMRPHAMLETDQWKLECRSDAPGILVYSANGLENGIGKGGVPHGKNYAVCLETERFPNAVNIESLRKTVILSPGETYRSATEFCFAEK